MKFLDKIRKPKGLISNKKNVISTIGILLFGVFMGLFSKFLDYRHAELQGVLKLLENGLDLHNFLGEFSLWIIIAVCISVYSRTPIRSAINVFLFFFGFVASYYIYSNFVAGFFPRSYAFIWFVFTLISPLLAFICWYAKGRGPVALIISSGILGVLLNTTFYYGLFYIDLRSWLNLIILVIGVFILHKTPKETAAMIGIAVIFAVFIKMLIPFGL